MRRSLTVRLVGSYLILVVLLCVAWVVALAGTNSVQLAYQRTVIGIDNLTFNVTLRTNLMDDEETGLRGYLLTGRAVFLQPYNAARRRLPALRRSTRALAAMEPAAQPLVAALSARALAWDRWAALVRRAPHALGAAVAQQLRGKYLFDRYRVAAQQLTAYLAVARQRALATSTGMTARLRVASGVLALLSAVLVALLAWRTTRTVSRPLALLTQAAQAIGRGEMDRAIAVSGSGEITQLAAAMDWMRRQWRRSHAELRRSEERFRALTEHSSDLLKVLDADGAILYASPSHRHILGYQPADLVGRSIMDLVHPDDAPRVHLLLAAHEGTVARTELRQPHADGSWRVVEIIANNRLDDPTVRGIIINARDVTARKQAEETARHQSLHDALTGLPNRTLLLDRLEQAISLAARTRRAGALLLIDLNRFKEVNDTLGHHHGDLLLHQVATRLHAVLRDSDTVARLGGDEFAIVLPGDDAANAAACARRVNQALAAPFVVDDSVLHIGGSIGIALYPEHGTDPHTLMRRADVAMYVTKRSGGGCTVYTAEHDHYSPTRLALGVALREAIAQGKLTLHYQPKIDLHSGRVSSVEALARWHHAEYGQVRPDQFIPLAEQTGLIAPLMEWVLDAALRQCRAWRQAGLELGVAVNLSMANLHDSALAETIAGLLMRHGIAPALLRLELTESSVMEDVLQSIAGLTRLARLGVRISVDDFGTGYSSLAYLKRLPVDELKIDQSFVRHMTEDETDAAIVASTISLGHSLGLAVVAEGVETEGGWKALERLGCDTAQGYYVSPPLPADEMTRWVHRSPWAVA